jgi:hypothetical protein
MLSHKVPLTLNLFLALSDITTAFGDDPVQRIHDHQRLNSVSERQEIAKAISSRTPPGMGSAHSETPAMIGPAASASPY